MTQLTLELMRMAWPTDWSSVFGRQAPLLLEIGFGNGLFLLHQAQQQPESNFLGIEIAMPSLKRAASRIRHADMNNVRLIRASAQSVLQLLCEPSAVHGVVINFPDPWPKASHSHRRLISTSFLELLATRMAPEAGLDIATDHREYGEWIADHLLSSPYFESRLDRPYLKSDTDRVRTKYEQKGLSAGNTSLYFKWRRNLVVPPDRFRLMEELPMPHVVVSCPLKVREIAEHFEPWQCAHDDISIRFIDLYRSQKRPSLIVDTYVSEKPLDQRLMIEIYRRPDNDYLVRLQATGFPRTTKGVHVAIACLTKWLCVLDRTARVKRHNLRVSADSVQLSADDVPSQ